MNLNLFAILSKLRELQKNYSMLMIKIKMASLTNLKLGQF